MKHLKTIFACLLMAVLSIGQVWADDVTGTINFGSASGSTNVNAASKTGDDSQGNTWTVTTTGTTSFTPNSAYAQIGSSSKPASSITFTTTLAASQTITAFSAKFGGFSGTAGTVTLKVGDETVGTGSLNAASDVTVSKTGDDVAGTVLTVEVTGISKGVKAYYISYTYDGGGATLTSIDITGTPDKTVYEAGENFDPTGLVATGNYDDSSSEDLTSSVTWDYTPAGALTQGLTSVNVTATKGTVVGNKDIDITVNAHVVTPGEYEVQLSNTLWGVSSGQQAAGVTSMSGEANDISFTTTKGSNQMYASATQTRFYANSTLTIAVPTGYVITSVVFAEPTSDTRWDGSISADNGEYTAGTKTWEGEENSVTFTFGAQNRAASATVTYALYVAPSVETPTFSVPGGSYLDEQSVTITCGTTGADIYYTLDGTDPDDGSTPYTGAISISETKTLKAIAINGSDESSIASATYTIVTPLTVAQAIALIPNTNDQVDGQYVEGYVCTAGTSVSSGKMTYYISADGSETNRLQIYKGKNLNNADFSAVGDLAVGDKVVVYGQLKNFGGTPEMNDGNYIKRYTAKGALTTVAVSGTPTKTAYSADEAFDPAGLVVTATYENGYAVAVTPESWSATPATVSAEGDISVTATYGGQTSAAYPVHVTVLAATLDHISLSYDAVEVYQGKPLLKPVVTAHWSDASTSDVTALASFTGYDKDTPGDQTITVSYQFGTGDPEEATYTVTVKPIYNVELAASVAKDLIETVVGNTESTDDMIVRGIVSQVGSISSKCLTYYISDDGTTTNQLEIYKGKYLSNADFTDGNKLKVGDEVVVTGKVIFYNNNTAEFASGKSQVTSLARVPNFAITDVTALEVGATDLAVADLTINVEGEGAITLVSGDDTKATIVSNAIHAVAPGTVTITANLAADGIYKAATTTFNVTVIAATVKYAISFDGNGADGGSAPVIADKAAGVSVDLPANSFTYAGHLFTGWKVFNDDTSEEIEVNAGAFEMPASTVTIQAQWAEISVWATTYTSNVTLSYTGTGEANSQVKINDEDYAAQKVGSSGNDGSVVVTVPYGTHTLHFHAVAWNGKSVTIAASGVENMSESSFTLAADPGFKSSGTYTLENDPVGQYFVMTFTAVTAETQITFSKTAGDDKRFMLYGVNQVGGVLPELQSIAISGDLDNKSYKAGQALDMTGLTVSATYTLGGTPQTPVDITNNPGLTWTYDPLVENQEEVTVTAHFGDPEQTASKTIEGLTVTTADPKIYVSTLNVDFGSVEVGEAVPANETVTVTLTNVAAATAALGGTNPEAFSITPAALTTSGDITISILANTDAAATYSATLTISDDATENPADSKVINLSFAVIEPVVNEEYQLVSDVASLAAGDQIIIVAENAGDYYTLDGSISSQYFPSTAVSISAGIITAPTTSAIILGKDEDNWTMSMGGQLIGATAAKKASLGNTTTATNTWTIAIAENVATITNTAEGYGSLQFNYNNGSNSRFLNYTSAQTAVAIYKKVAPEPPTPSYTTVRTELTAGWYYTMCLDKAVTAVQGGSIWRVLSKAANGNDVILEEVIGTLDAGRPYIFFATANTLQVAYTGDAVGAPVTEGNNGLVGSFTEEPLAQNSNHYIIYNNALYYVNSDNVKVGEHRAYLDMTGVPAYNGAAPAPGRRRVTMAAHGPQTATGIEDLNASEKPMKMMINGQIFILRGEKIYDTTGRLVK